MAIGYALLPVTPDVASVVRNNIGHAQLGDMAELFAEVALGRHPII